MLDYGAVLRVFCHLGETQKLPRETTTLYFTVSKTVVEILVAGRSGVQEEIQVRNSQCQIAMGVARADQRHRVRVANYSIPSTARGHS